MNIDSNSQFSIRASVIRADGKIEELGTVVGGTTWQKIASYFRIKKANAKQLIKKLRIKLWPQY